MYYFQVENYERALKLFEQSKSHLSTQLATNSHSEQMRIYLNDLDSYLIALSSASESTEINLEKSFSLPNQLAAKKIAKKYISIENEMRKLKSSTIDADQAAFAELINQLVDDNICQ